MDPSVLHPLMPAPALTADDVVSELDFSAWAPPDRPYVVVNMVSTVDGRVTLDGRAGPIGNEADAALFDSLRTLTDAVMVGARTAAIEGYHRLLTDPARRAQRQARGLKADPVAVLISARLTVPANLPLLQDPASDVVIVTASDQTLSGCQASIDYIRHDDVITDRSLSSRVRRCRREFSV